MCYVTSTSYMDNYQSNGDEMLVQRTNPMGTRWMYIGPICMGGGTVYMYICKEDQCIGNSMGYAHLMWSRCMYKGRSLQFALHLELYGKHAQLKVLTNQRRGGHTYYNISFTLLHDADMCTEVFYLLIQQWLVTPFELCQLLWVIAEHNTLTLLYTVVW